MEKKRLYEFALIVAGTYEEYQDKIIEGIVEYSKQNNINISAFTIFNDLSIDGDFAIGECSIYSLINYSKFDGIILMINTIQNQVAKNMLIEHAKNSGLPVVTFDYESNEDNFYNITIDNYIPMKNLVEHVIDVHNAKKLYFISGPSNNPEAKTRLKAFKDVCDNAGILDEDIRVFGGTFRPSDGKLAIKQMIEDGFWPDAVIAANDAMALAAIKELNDYGYNVPNDIIVTGFDNTFIAAHNSPSLSTVDRPLVEIGKRACDTIMKHIEEIPYEKTYMANANVIIGDSCGCHNHRDEDINEYKQSMLRSIENNRYDMLCVNTLISKLTECNTVNACMEPIVEFANKIDCEKICVCLYDNPFQENAIGLMNEDNGLTAPLIWINGNRIDDTLFNKSEIDPRPYSDGGNISYYFPVHYGKTCFGYFIISNSDFPRRSFACHTLVISLGNTIENINKLNNLNAALREINNLYIMDQLCNIYNRNGLLCMSKGILEKCEIEHKSLMISFIDMDGLKHVNDTYGHKEGDFALKTIARAISNSCLPNMVCARFGGDEFVVVGVNASTTDFEKRLNHELELANNTYERPYQFECSVGSIVTEVNDNTDLFRLITEADGIMYEQKKRKKTSKYIRRD